MRRTAVLLSLALAGCGAQAASAPSPPPLPAGTSLGGRWVIPAVAGRNLAGSLSGDGGTLALAGPRGDGSSSFALVSTRRATRPQVITLRGRWSFDALSPDGRLLYLIEHTRRPGHYQVRVYDAAKDQLRSGAIIEKGEADADMTGSPVAREIGRRGEVVYTLYRGGDEGDFV